MKLSLIILVTTIMAEIAENSNLRTPKPLHMVLDDLLQLDSSSSGPYGGYLRWNILEKAFKNIWLTKKIAQHAFSDSLVEWI